MASSAQPGTGPSGEFRFPGNRLGLPEAGPGSAAGWGRRIVALLLDWLIAGLIASAVTGKPIWAGGNDFSTAQLVTFFGMSAILGGLAGGTIGHRALGLRVLSLKAGPNSTGYGAQVGLLGGVIRAVLLCLFLPAVVFDRDHRGLHDRAANTIVVRR
ncbi:RDD family protein [Kribbella sp. NPDC058245]|uniref:RDD family protein n=1 Tax=Kribbella sp. NPDC058245 TaxID=3346399 RepID=UPI0036E50BD4